MISFRFIITVPLLWTLNSCSPEYTVSRYGMKARLTDAVTREPLGRVKTRILIDRQEFARTSDKDGVVSVKPDLDWHISWLGGPAWISRASAQIGLEAEGYREKSFTWEKYLSASPFSEEGGVVDLGTVGVDRR